MFNHDLGARHEDDGRSCIVTEAGRSGHVLWGPYARLAAGDHAVEFHLACRDAAEPDGAVCATLDVTRDAGRETLARAEARLGQLREGRTPVALRFRLERPDAVEYRVHVSGAAALVIDEYRRVVPVPAGERDVAALLARDRFPDAPTGAPPFLRDHRATLRRLHETGVGVRVERGAVVLTIDGVSFFARSPDDLIFIGEVFDENTYHFRAARPACVVDVGMNIGLTSLLFATRPGVTRVHAFEPFPATYARAVANLSLNPTLAGKIEAVNCGLSDEDLDDVIPIREGGDSGAMSTVRVSGGTPVALVLRDAGTTLAPIVAVARAEGLAVVVKVDCEGSEFAVFRSLEAAGLLSQVDAFMVEWHAMFEGVTQEALIAPLVRAGFVVFDRSPRTGNGFFYAVRAAPADGQSALA